MLPELFTRITLGWTGIGVPRGAATVFAVANPNNNDPVDVATSVASAITTSTLLLNLTDDVAITSVLAKNGPDSTGISGEIGTSIAGGVSSAGATPNVAFLVRKSSTMGGRRGGGRMFLPGVPESLVNEGGQLTGPAISAINTDLEALRTTLIAADHDMVLEHFDTYTWTIIGGQPRRVYQPGTAPDPSGIFALAVDGIASTQRRRLR